MKFCLITFRSVTPAQRAESVLHRAGFECNVQRTPRWMEEQGCGYSLRVKFPDVMRCVELLHRNAVSFRKVYLLKEKGTVEELAV
ncbi:MAG: DUF3343 domain-containing protein [Oscillospiraceae bacterium]|nr:DUF3343 domain-containing protein [Oscillospiraceae bacterium]